MRTRQELGEAIVAILRDPPPPGMRPQLDWFLPDAIDQLARHASKHRVLPFLRRALQLTRLATTHEVAIALERRHAHFAAVHLMALEDLKAVQQILSVAGVDPLVIKGPVLAERHYPSADLRPYGDLDLLVAPAEFETTIAALEGAGLELVDRNWDLIRSEGRAQLHLVLPHGTLADIHWNVLNRRSVRETFRISTEDLASRARTLSIAGIPVRTLDATDTLLHLCVHATLSGGDRLIWSKDVERVIAAEPPDWHEVVRRSTSWRAGPSVAIALERARRILGADVPAEVVRELSGSGVRRALTTLVDRARPPERSAGEMSVAVLWSQICREGWGSTIAAAKGRASRRSKNLLHGASRDEAPIYHEAGGAGAERRYLGEVSDPGDAGPGQTSARS